MGKFKTGAGSHEPAVCTTDKRLNRYSKRCWQGLFVCPTCGRKTWQALNFLGRRRIVCDGARFHKQEEQQ